MLSKVSVLILGIIAEKPLNPYEITKLLEKIHIKNWFSIAASSVYVTIKKLDKKDYIIGETIKEGNMPEKTIYTVTEKGKMALSDALVEFLLDTELDPVKFNIATIMLCHLKKDEALKVLEKRMFLLENYEKGIKKHYHQSKEIKTPFTGLKVISHNICLVQMELKLARELLAEVKKDDKWNHFVARDL